MLFQLRTDNHIRNNESLAGSVQAEVEAVFTRRCANRVQRLEVYLQDVNAHKGGIDTRCAIQAHLAGLKPIAVGHMATDVGTAVSGAVEKMRHALEHSLGTARPQVSNNREVHMNKQDDWVDEASDESFPASDPPSWTPVTGTSIPHATVTLRTEGEQTLAEVENGRGEELRQHLASHGIKSSVRRTPDSSCECVVIEGNADHEAVRAILDHWER